MKLSAKITIFKKSKLYTHANTKFLKLNSVKTSLQLTENA